jgi:membrane associated rhomboid family serine protease
MEYVGIVGLLLVITTVGISYKGFSNAVFFDRNKFEVEGILVRKEYGRILSSGFLHGSWMHLIFNMLSLYAFSDSIEYILGGINFLLIYFASLVGGNLFGLFIHRHHPDYSAIGASGAVSGIIFAAIALFPGITIHFMFVPFGIPSWLYGVLFMAFSIYGIRSNRDNIGHEAHLGGALIGMMVTLALRPRLFLHNYVTVLLIAVPALVFIYLVITRPSILLVNNYFGSPKKDDLPDHLYNERKNQHQKEMDRILDKIGEKGMESLSKKEKEKLEEYSKRIR